MCVTKLQSFCLPFPSFSWNGTWHAYVITKDDTELRKYTNYLRSRQACVCCLRIQYSIFINLWNKQPKNVNNAVVKKGLKILETLIYAFFLPLSFRAFRTMYCCNQYATIFQHQSYLVNLTKFNFMGPGVNKTERGSLPSRPLNASFKIRFSYFSSKLLLFVSICVHSRVVSPRR